jgi:hypothetical protein
MAMIICELIREAMWEDASAVAPAREPDKYERSDTIDRIDQRGWLLEVSLTTTCRE